MKVFIRTDASFTIGTGHVRRCLNLADEIRRRGGDIHFVCRKQDGNLVTRIGQEGYAVTEIVAGSEAEDASKVVTEIGDSPPDWLVVDHYDLGPVWEWTLRPFAKRILVIDDLARHHDCDALLDQNWFGDYTDNRYVGRLQSTCHQLLGPHYALLGCEYAALRNSIRDRQNPPKRLLVSFGGTDPTNETAKALSALMRPQFSHLDVDLVLGSMHARSPEEVVVPALRARMTVHQAPPSLAGLIAQADYSLGAAGTTTWERLCLGLPSAVVSVAENQVATARALAEAGYVRWIGCPSQTTPSHYAEALSHPLSGFTALPNLVDGLGASRCAEYMMTT